MVVMGLESPGENVHLRFGIEYHKVLENYDHYKFAGASHDEAMHQALEGLMCSSASFVSDDSNKNRETLVRSAAFYMEEFKDDPFKTMLLADGKPAVELSFRFESGDEAVTGEPILLCGHLDRVGEFQDNIWVLDRKTTKSALYGDYFAKYSPDNQMSLYTLAGQVVLGSRIKGIIIDAAQILVSGTRFQRGMTHRTAEQIEEWKYDFNTFISMAPIYAEREHWPMNDKSCHNYGGCQFRELCSKAPSVRPSFYSKFNQRQWDPMVPR